MTLVGATGTIGDLLTWDQPEGTRPVATQHFQFDFWALAETGGGFGQPGPSGADTVVFQPNSPYTQDKWKMRPFDVQPVLLRGISWALITPGPLIHYILFGNRSRPDGFVRAWGVGATHGHAQFTHGGCWPWPKASDASPLDYIDVHGAANVGDHGTIKVHIEYEPLGPLPVMPAPACTTFDSLNPSDKGPTLALSNGNRTVSNSGATTHGIVRAVAGIAPNTGAYHWEHTRNGGAGGSAICVVGLMDAATAVTQSFDQAATAVGLGYNPTAAGHIYAQNFTSGPSAYTAPANGVYAEDYNSDTGVYRCRGPNGIDFTRTLSGSPTTLFPAIDFYGSPAGSVTFNFGDSLFQYSVPDGAQAGLCQ